MAKLPLQVVGALGLTCVVLLLACDDGADGIFWNAMDARYWKCIYKRGNTCPDPDIKFYMYTNNSPFRKRIDLRSTTALRYGGWDPHKKNVIIVHGFNSTERKAPMTIIRDSFLSRGDYNVFTVDWEPLTIFPCYLSALSNTRLVAQCSAQFYSHLTAHGVRAENTLCVGHSLGAHICGMMSNHMDRKMHKIIGLDPARPLLDKYGRASLKLTRDDAHIVHVVHTNAGMLGEEAQVGHADFCINGGRVQPSCKGHRLRKSRCSHFLSACYLATAVAHPGRWFATPCTTKCRPLHGSLIANPGVRMPFGEHTPDSASGTYCMAMRLNKDCPFD